MSLRHVLIVTETYRPEINGVATTLGNWVDGLLRLGIKVTIIRPRQSKHDTPKQDASENVENEILVFGVPIPGYAELKFGLTRTSWMTATIRKINPDSIYIATEGPLGYTALKASKVLGINAITGFHTNFQSYSRFYNFGFLESLITRYLRWFHNSSAGTLVPTMQQKLFLERHGFKNITIVSRGIDHTLFSREKRSQELRASWDVKEEDAVFLYVGRIAAEKNLDLLARTYETVTNRYPTAKFVLVGDGPLKPQLAKTHPGLIFAGVKRGEELASHYASGDIFLFPSKTDTFGNVITEAMVSGCCICAFDAAAAGEHLRHYQSGFLADLGDDEAFIENAITAYEKRQLRANISSASHRISMNLSWNDIVQKFCSILLSVHPAIDRSYHANRTNINFKPESPRG